MLITLLKALSITAGLWATFEITKRLAMWAIVWDNADSGIHHSSTTGEQNGTRETDRVE